MSDKDNLDGGKDFLRELLGDELYSELKGSDPPEPEPAPPPPPAEPEPPEPEPEPEPEVQAEEEPEEEFYGLPPELLAQMLAELPVKTPAKTAAIAPAIFDLEDRDMKIYDKDNLSGENLQNALRVEYADDDELSFVSGYFDDEAAPEDAAVEDEEDQGDEDEENASSRLPPTLRVLLYVVSVLAVSVTIAFLVWLAADDVLALTGTDETVSFTVTQFDSMSMIASNLKSAGLIKYPTLFQAYGLFSGAKDKIEPGTYDLNDVYDYRALVVAMEQHQETRKVVTVVIPEGYEQEQIFQLLDENDVATMSDLSQAAANQDFDYDFLDGLEPGLYNRLEGYLFPDTYDFYVDEDPVSVINKLLSNFDRKFDDKLKERISVLNEDNKKKILQMYSTAYPADELQTYIEEHMLDEHDIVIIASLIEKEAANDSERSKISSIIHNRLISKLYPTLKIDATIQYVLAERKELLTYDDLSIDSPYNTYKNPGLPVGPIANPGLASIRSALYPAETDYYFYALDTDGTHDFFKTAEEQADFLLKQKQEQSDEADSD